MDLYPSYYLYMIQAILTMVLNLANTFWAFFNNRSKNEELITEDKAKKFKNTQDTANELINKALAGDKEALDELRKRIS